MNRSSSPTVLMAPDNRENPYLPSLVASLNDIGVDAGYFEMRRTSSQTMNALLAPLSLWRARRRGATTWHLHWVYEFAWPAVANVSLLRRLPRWWFHFSVAFARWMGFTVVFTWHDLVPLNGVFDDDEKSRRRLCRQLDGVIVINEAARRDVCRRFGIDPALVNVIPEGAPALALKQRQRGETPVIAAFGHVDAYKGYDLLLECLSAVQVPVSVEILGVIRDHALEERISDLARSARSHGHDVKVMNHTFSDAELEDLLSRADVVALPFRYITNSTTMRMAMAARTVTVLPALAALADVPEGAAVRFSAGSVDELAAAIERAVSLTDEERHAMTDLAASWATAWTWRDVAIATDHVYRESASRRRHGQRIA